MGSSICGRDGGLKRLGRGAVVVAFAALLLASGCSLLKPSGLKDSTAQAFFNYETNEIVKPLDQYDVLASWDTLQLLRRSMDVAVGKCMSALGYKYLAAQTVDLPESNVGSREYGLWNVEAARKYAYIPPRANSKLARENDSLTGGEAWLKAQAECAKNLPPEIESLFPDRSDPNSTDSLVSRLKTDAYNFASADPDWAAARVPWEECLRKAGLDPQPNRWGTVQEEELLKNSTGEVTPEAIQIAYTEAKCNMDSGMAQNLANLEAAYQKPLIDANQAALNKLKTRLQEQLTTARGYIAANG